MGRIAPNNHKIHSTHLNHVSATKRVIRVNPWIDLIQTTTKVILHIFTEFQGHCFEIKELLE